jgi:PAS domain S-box-containing protein
MGNSGDTNEHKPLADFAAILARPDVRASEFDILYELSIMPTCFVSEDGTFMSVNAAFAEMLGYSRLELIGVKKWQDVTHREDIETYSREATALAAGKQDCYRIQKRYLHKDGRYVYCVVQVSRVPRLGEFVHFVKQAQEIPVASKNLEVHRDANGNPMIVPFVSFEDFIKRHWKWFVAILGPVITWVGITANDYYATKARAEYQQQEINRQQDEMNKLRSRLDTHGVK